ncbi:MAG: hypothetical protein KBC52_07200 [Clostridia bacterium]|nr:hypothetical protein [Clostridia bacterium]
MNIKKQTSCIKCGSNFNVKYANYGSTYLICPECHEFVSFTSHIGFMGIVPVEWIEGERVIAELTDSPFCLHLNEGFELKLESRSLNEAIRLANESLVEFAEICQSAVVEVDANAFLDNICIDSWDVSRLFYFWAAELDDTDEQFKSITRVRRSRPAVATESDYGDLIGVDEHDVMYKIFSRFMSQDSKTVLLIDGLSPYTRIITKDKLKRYANIIESYVTIGRSNAGEISIEEAHKQLNEKEFYIIDGDQKVVTREDDYGLYSCTRCYFSESIANHFNVEKKIVRSIKLSSLLESDGVAIMDSFGRVIFGLRQMK